MKSALIFLLKLVGLAVFYFICFVTVSSALFQLANEEFTTSEGNPALSLLVVSCLNTAILSYVITRSRWVGWKLVGAIFLILFGISTFLPQIETAYFVTRLPAGMLPRLFIAGGITAGLFAPVAVLVLGKRKHDEPEEGNIRLSMPLAAWVWKQSLIIVAYVIIYFTFGYFIAWKSSAVRSYYGGTDPGNFLAQMGNVLRDTPWLLPLQAVRAMLWTALAVLVIRMMKGVWWEIALVVGLLFTILTSAQLLIPNPFMPGEVRMAHLLETAPSNFLFGCLVVWVLSSGGNSKQLVGRSVPV